MFSHSQVINTIWKEWQPGECKDMQGSLFHSVVFDKHDGGLRIRLVFEQDVVTQQIINLKYEWIPDQFQVVFDGIGRKVKSVIAEGTQDHAVYVVSFEDGYWFRI